MNEGEASDNMVYQARDFVGAGQGSSSPGLSKSSAVRAGFSEEWIAREMKASAQLNPMEPYRRVGFDPKFFGLM